MLLTKKHSARIDMTQGNLFSQILAFMLPLIISNLLQQFYHAADVMVVGLSSEADAVGAVGSTSSFLSMIRNLFIGFSVGANVVVARYIGKKDKENTSRAVHTAICMSVLFGVLGAIVGISLTKVVLVGMGYEGNLLLLGIRYSYIYLACMPFLALTNFLSAILHAQGNTSTSLTVLSATGILNVALNFLFVLGFGLSVEGVAIATAVANLTSAVILWGYLSKKGEDCSVSFKKLRVSRDQFKEIARIGFPSGIQSTLFSVSNILIQSSVLQVNNAVTPTGASYAPVVKGVAAAGSIENFFMSALNAVTTAASAFSAQNAGAKNYRRVRQSLFKICLIGMGVALLFCAIGILFRDPLLSLYGVTKTSDKVGMIAYEAAQTRIFWKWITLFLYAMMCAGAGTLRGLGKSATTAMITFFGTCVFRVVWIYTAFQIFENLETIFLSYGISWLMTGGVFFIYAFRLIRKKIREEQEMPSAAQTE